MPNHQIKINRAFAKTNLLPSARTEILKTLNPELIESLTSNQLAQVLNNLNTHWHKAQAAARADEKADSAYWIEERLIPAEAIRAIRVAESSEDVPREPTKQFPASFERWTTREYTLNYRERF